MKKNSKKILISVAVAAILAACGIGGYYATSKPKEQKKEVVLEEGEKVSDGTVEFSVYNEETGEMETINTTYEEIEKDEVLKEKWNQFLKAAEPSPEASNTEEKVEEGSSETKTESTSSETFLHPAFTIDEAKKKEETEYSTKEGSVSEEKCKKILDYAEGFYFEMEQESRDRDEFFIKYYKALKNKHTEKNYEYLKSALLAVTGEEYMD